jgi:hypothetical protein
VLFPGWLAYDLRNCVASMDYKTSWFFTKTRKTSPVWFSKNQLVEIQNFEILGNFVKKLEPLKRIVVKNFNDVKIFMK